MAKHEISNLLDELKSQETYIRNDAIKRIIKEKINDDQILIALKEATENDPSMSVRNFARSALDIFGVEHSALEEPIVETHSPVVKTRRDEVRNEKNEPVLRTEDAVKFGIIIGIIPTIFVVLFPCMVGGGFWGLQFAMVFGTPIGMPGGIAGALAGKSLKGSRDIVIIGSILGTILGIMAWLLFYEELGAPFGYIG